MHSAASVAYPVARSRRVGGLLVSLWGVGAVALAWWLWVVPAPWALRAALVVWTCSAGMCSGWIWWRTEACSLLWDGQSWRTETPMGAVHVAEAQLTVAADFQRLMLLRLTPPRGRVCWLWADRAAAPQLWHGLRCAVTAVGYVSGNSAHEAVLP